MNVYLLYIEALSAFYTYVRQLNMQLLQKVFLQI